MKHLKLLFFLLFFCCGNILAQNVNDLGRQLHLAKSDTARLRLLNTISTAFFNVYEYDSCKEYAEKALQLSQQLLSSTMVNENPEYTLYCKNLWAKSLENLASSFMAIHTQTAIDSFKNVEKIYSETGNKDGLASVFQKLGETYANQNSYESSLVYLNKSLKQYQQIGNRTKIAYLYYVIALTQRGMAKYGDALENNLQALAIAREIKDSSFIIECLLANGFIYMLAKDFSAALKNQEDALIIARALNDSDNIATTFSDMGNTNMRSGRLDTAFKNFSTALAIRKRSKLNFYLSSNLLYMSNILVKQGKYKEAIAYNFESLDYAKKNKDGRFILDSYAELASNFLLNHDNENALKYFDTVYQVGTAYKDKYRVSYALQGMADVYLKQNNPQLAQVTLIKAIKDTDSSDYRNLEDIYRRISGAYEASENYKMAYLSSIQYKRYSDSVSAIEKAAKLASLTNQLEFQNKKAMLKASQDKQLSVQQSEIRRQKLVRNITIVGLLIAFIWALIFFKRFREKRNMNIQLEKTLEDLKSAQVQLIHSEKMASLGELTAGIAHEIQNPLNFVNNFSEVNKELISELVDEVDKGNTQGVKDIALDIKENSDKINHHGKRADAIVKGMLHHSRKSEGKKEPTDINALCDEYLRLSYHGLRAKDKTFNAKFETAFDENLPKIKVVSQDIGRVILNLINNAFFAVAEKKKAAPENFEPTVKIITQKLDGKVVIKVKDNGNGIPKSVKDKIFQPFFTTKPTGQGTGLGLSLSYDIVKAHGGEIKVETMPGEAAAQSGTEFTIILPNT